MTDVTAPTEPVVTPTEPAGEPATPELSIDEELDAIWDRGDEPATEAEGAERDDKGRFKAKTEGDEGAQEKAEGEAEPEEEGASKEAPADEPTLRAPSTWTKEAQAEWEKVPPGVQAEILRRERNIDRMATEASQVRQRFDGMEEVVAPYERLWQQNGFSPAAVLNRYVAAEQRLMEDPYSAIAELANHYGVDLTAYSGQVGEDNENAAQQRFAYDPRVDAIEAENAEMRNFINQMQEKQHQSDADSVDAVINDFRAAHPYLDDDAFEAVSQDMARYVAAGDTIEDAYKAALALNKYADIRLAAVRAREPAPQATQSRKEREERARRASGVNVKSGPVSGSPKRSVDDDLDEIGNRFYGR